MPKTKSSGPRFKLVQDNDSHWYVIPSSKNKDWCEFLSIPDNDERSWDVPEWAKRIDGPHRITFEEWKEE